MRASTRFSHNLIRDSVPMFFRGFPQWAESPCCVVLLVFTTLCGTALAATTHAASTVDSGYLTALVTADHLLQSWQAGDAENGMALLTNHAKEKAGPEAIERFFSGSHFSAYEIGHGKLARRGRYEFPVVLVNRSSSANRIYRQFSTIIVLNTGNDGWAVDKLP